MAGLSLFFPWIGKLANKQATTALDSYAYVSVLDKLRRDEDDFDEIMELG